MVLENKVFNFRQCIFAISIISPLGIGWDPSFEENKIPFTQGCFLSSLVDIGLVVFGGFGEERFLNSVNLFSLFRNYLPLEKGKGPSFEET